MTTQYVNTRFSIQNAERFLANVRSTNNLYYVFVGKSQPGANDVIASNLELSTDYLEYQYYREMIFGKRLANTNVTQMIKRYEWAPNTVFTAYDHRTENLQDTDFYCTVNTGIAVEVFKCIWNNNNAPSTIKPEASVTDAQDNYFELADGYRWKWMYSVSSANLAAFVPASANFVPVEQNANVVANAISGRLTNFVIEDGGANYNSYTDGTFSDVSINGNTFIHQLQSNASSNNDFYKGCAIKIITGSGAGQQRRVSEYIGVSRRVFLDSPFEPAPNNSSTYEVSPDVDVIGDGTGLRARALMNVTSNSIFSIEITDGGQNYTWANVQILGNTGIISGNSVLAANSANVVAIISPPGGHGANAYSELFAQYIGISIPFANTESNTIPIDNDFHTIGVIHNPLFANVLLGVANLNTSFTPGETVTQQNTFATGTVESYSTNALFLTNVFGRFQTGNSTFGRLIGGTSGADGQCANITNNGQVKQFETFDQRTRLTININVGPGFTEDERVFESTGGVEFANGFVHASNSTFLAVTNTRGNFQESDISTINLVTGEDSATVANVTGLLMPDLIPFTGNLLYIENIIPVSRDQTQTETIRLVFKL